MSDLDVLDAARSPARAAAPAQSSLIRFGAFEFDLAAGSLFKQGRKVPLQDQPARLLALLVSRAGSIVTREDVRRALWTDNTFVEFDAGMHVAVTKLRQALKDSASAPRFIETVPRRGYRFLADVHRIERRQASRVTASTPEPHAESASASRWQEVVSALRSLVAYVARFARATLPRAAQPDRFDLHDQRDPSSPANPAPPPTR